MPLDIERIIEPSDPVYTFLEVVLFAFMELGSPSLRVMEKLCKYKPIYFHQGKCRFKPCLSGRLRESFVQGCGHRKSLGQKAYEGVAGCLEKLKKYARQIKICGEGRNI